MNQQLFDSNEKKTSFGKKLNEKRTRYKFHLKKTRKISRQTLKRNEQT